MSLEETLKKAAGRIRSGALKNETNVKKSVVDPVLRALGWDDEDPAEVDPGFSVGAGRAGYALLREGGSPLVFIGVDALGRMDAANEKPVFRHAVNKGVPLLVLTDGDIWDFYLSMAEGDPAERRFCRAELTRGENLSECVESLETYLRKSRVVSDEARRDAAERLRVALARTKARDAIPGVWRNLLETPDDILRELIAEEVEGACETRPDVEDVKAFLRVRLSEFESAASASRPKRAAFPSRRAKRRRNPKIIGFLLDGDRFETGNGITTLAEILKEFARRDPEFMARLAPQVEGKQKTADGTLKRRLVAHERRALYTDPRLVQKASIELENGWWLATKSSTAQKLRYIRIACEVAGVKLGSQLRLIDR